MGAYLSTQLKDLTLDNVEIQEKLGEGTFGVVSAVTFKRKDGSFASGVGKQLVGGTVSQEMGDKIRLLFRLQHSNIAQLYGLYFDSQAAPLPMLVTERLQIPLENYLQTRSSDDGVDKLHILNSVVSAIVYLHSQQPPLVHGHLTSHNVLVMETSSKVIAKVTDTGLPALLQVTPQDYAQRCPSARVYLPPEALAGDVCLFPAADVFAFGVLMVRVLLHRIQLPESAPVFELSSGKMVLAAETQGSSYIVSLLSSHPHPQYPLLQHCLSKSPNRRPEASELQEALQIEQVRKLVAAACCRRFSLRQILTKT